MVAHVKRHKVARSKSKARRKTRQRKAQPAQKLILSAIPMTEPAPAPATEDEEPRPEDLAKEEPIKPAEIEDAVRAAEGEATVRARHDRGSYDGDTAIKLYLREIGQVKLLTPQEEIDLAARIKKGDKKAREQ